MDRLEVAAAVVDGLLYVAGGFGPGGARVTTAVEIYDPVADRWRRGPDLPLAVHHAMAVAYEGSFVVLGGFNDPSFANPSRRVFALRDGAWRELPTMRRARAAGAAGVVGDQLVVAAGQDGARLVTATEVFDGMRWRDGARIPTARDHVAGAGDAGGLYVVGGRERSITSVLGAFERYDPAADRWERLSPLPTPRGGMGAAVANGLLVVPGGEGPTSEAGSDGVYEETEAYDIARGRWLRLPEMRTARHGTGVASIGAVVFVAHGGREAGFTWTRTLEAIDVSGV